MGDEKHAWRVPPGLGGHAPRSGVGPGARGAGVDLECLVITFLVRLDELRGRRVHVCTHIGSDYTRGGGTLGPPAALGLLLRDATKGGDGESISLVLIRGNTLGVVELGPEYHLDRHRARLADKGYQAQIKDDRVVVTAAGETYHVDPEGTVEGDGSLREPDREDGARGVREKIGVHLHSCFMLGCVWVVHYSTALGVAYYWVFSLEGSVPLSLAC